MWQYKTCPCALRDGGFVEPASIGDLDRPLAQGIEGWVLLAFGHGGGKHGARALDQQGAVRQRIVFGGFARK